MKKKTKTLPRSVVLAMRICERYKFADKTNYFIVKECLLSHLAKEIGIAKQKVHYYEKVRGKKRRLISSNGRDDLRHVGFRMNLLKKYALTTLHPATRKECRHYFYLPTQEYRRVYPDHTMRVTDNYEELNPGGDAELKLANKMFAKDIDVRAYYEQVLYFTYLHAKPKGDVKEIILQNEGVQEQIRHGNIIKESEESYILIKNTHTLDFERALRTKTAQYDGIY